MTRRPIAFIVIISIPGGLVLSTVEEPTLALFGSVLAISLEAEARALGVTLACLERMTPDEVKEYGAMRAKWLWLVDLRRVFVEASYDSDPPTPPTPKQLEIEAELDRLEARMLEIGEAALARPCPTTLTSPRAPSGTPASADDVARQVRAALGPEATP